MLPGSRSAVGRADTIGGYGCQKRILICDDDPVILRLLEVNLQLEGFNVLLAHHGEEALEVATRETPDLIVLDIMMPRLDGYQTCRALKEQETPKDIPVIFLSAKAQASDVELGQVVRGRRLPDEAVRPGRPDRGRQPFRRPGVS